MQLKKLHQNINLVKELSNNNKSTQSIEAAILSVLQRVARQRAGTAFTMYTVIRRGLPAAVYRKSATRRQPETRRHYKRTLTLFSLVRFIIQNVKTPEHYGLSYGTHQMVVPRLGAMVTSLRAKRVKRHKLDYHYQSLQKIYSIIPQGHWVT